MNYQDIFEISNELNTYLIVPNGTKNNIVKIKNNYEIINKKLFLFNILTVDELIEQLSFSFDKEIFMHNLSVCKRPMSITKELIKFNKYNLDSNNLELEKFKEDNKSFLNSNQYFINNINNYKFNVIGPLYLLEPFIKHFNLNIKQIDITSEGKPKFFNFNTNEDECFYVLEEVSKLLDSGIDINKIYLSNVSNEYFTMLDKLSTYYKIPIIINKTNSLMNVPYISELFTHDYTEIIKLLNDSEKLQSLFEESYKVDNDEFNKNISKVISVFNKYPYFKYSDEVVLSIIKDEIKNTNINDSLISDGVKIIDLEELITIDNNSYVFILNAAYEHFPKLEKDSSYLSDTDKELINYPTSTLVNLSKNEYLSKLITLEAVKQVSFALKNSKNEFEESDIFSANKDSNTTTTHITINALTKGYSKDYYKTYFTNHNEGILQSTFDPSFKISNDEKEVMNKYIVNKELKLSPTDITKYIELPFVYYLERIIGLSTFKESVNLNLGNFFHIIIEVLLLVFFETKVDRSKEGSNSKFSNDEEIHQMIFDYIISLSKTDTDNFDYELYFNNFYNIYFKNELIKISNLDKKNLNHDDKLIIRSLFYIKKHEEVIINALKLLIDLENTIESEELIIEKPIEIELFKGKADLIKIYDDNSYSIIDYKTGSREAFNVEKIDELLDSLLNDTNDEISFGSLNLLQLILYVYVLNQARSDLTFKDLAYYSYFTDKLNGITTSTFNKTFYTNSKTRVIDSEELNSLFTKIETYLEMTINNIYDVNFNTDIRRDSKSKQGLDQSYYSIYEALIYFSEEGGTTDEDEDENY